ncbi:hypothetical protein JCM3765_003073 [Sporobolomyces pararoseus]
MDSNLNAQLDHFNLGDSKKGFESTFQLPPLAPSFPPSDPSLPLPISSTPSSTSSTSILSLPPELISEIFEEIPVHPSSERNSTLTSLCLVNHLFLDLARPLLYREVHLTLARGFTVSCSSMLLFTTLIGNGECAKLVKDLRISFRDQYETGTDTLGQLLNCLEGLVTIRAAWNQVMDPEEGEGFIQWIGGCKPQIQHLKLPWINLEHEAQDYMFSRFAQLKTYIGQLADPNETPVLFRSPLVDRKQPFRNVSCRLERLVLRGSVNSLALYQLLRLSHHTLSILSLTLLPESSDFDLSPFPNLTVLRLWINGGPERISLQIDKSATGNQKRESFAQDVRKTLRSVQQTSLKTLAIWTEEDFIGNWLARTLVPEMFLPRSLVNFSATLPLLGNDSSLVKALRGRSLPSLAKVCILPQLLEPSGVDLKTSVKSLLSVCSEFKVRLFSRKSVDERLALGCRVDFDQDDKDHKGKDSEDWYDDDEDSWDESSDYSDY